LSGVRYIKAMQIPIVAQTCNCQLFDNAMEKHSKHILFIGANQRMMRCNVLVVSEQMIPRIHRIPIDNKTVSSADLAGTLACEAPK
jgi:hypothetical protein